MKDLTYSDITNMQFYNEIASIGKNGICLKSLEVEFTIFGYTTYCVYDHTIQHAEVLRTTVLKDAFEKYQSL